MDTLISEPNLYSIKGIVILHSDGNRILAKYYDNTFHGPKEQKAFEKRLFNKTHRANSEIILLDNLICVYKSSIDVHIFVMGSSKENSILLLEVLKCLYDSLNRILRKNVEKRTLLDNLDIVILAIDEICDDGIILESDPHSLVSRVSLKSEFNPFGEQTVLNALQSAKEQLRLSLMR